jgi:hypothetical protein
MSATDIRLNHTAEMSFKRRTVAIVGVALTMACLTTTSQAQSKFEAQIKGYLETRHFGVFGVDSSLAKLNGMQLTFDENGVLIADGPKIDLDAAGFHPDEQYGVINRVRPSLRLLIGENTEIVTAVLGQSQHGFFGRSYDKIGDVVSVERLYLSIAGDNFDLLIGKQDFGGWLHTGLLANPTDIFNDTPAGDLQAEIPGYWSVQGIWGVTNNTNIILAAVAREESCCKPAIVNRLETTIGKTDMGFVFTWDNLNELLVGGFLLKTEFEIGAWLEASWTHNLQSEDGHIELEMGIDYSFSVLQQLYLAIEWIHQGNGVGEEWGLNNDTPADYFSLMRDSLGSGSRSQFMGTNYLVALARLSINSKWQVQLMNILNIGDPSGFAVLQLTWLPIGSLAFQAGAQVTYGKDGSEYAITVPKDPLYQNFQGARFTPEATVYLWGRYYF